MTRAMRYSEAAKMAFVEEARDKRLVQVTTKHIRSFAVRRFKVSGSAADSLAQHLLGYFVESGVLTPTTRDTVFGVVLT